jgi:multiple sugar transport system permease protein
VAGNFWRFIYEPRIGLFDYAVSSLGLSDASLGMLGSADSAHWAIVIVDVWMWTPLVMLVCLAGLRSIPREVYEVAELDRASGFRRFWSITLPRALPFIAVAALFRGIESFKTFDLASTLAADRAPSTADFASVALKRSAFDVGDVGSSAAFATILIVTVFAVAQIYAKALERLRRR